MKKFMLLLIILLGWLQYSLWLGKNGVHDYVRVQEDLVVQQENNAKLKLRNERLLAEISDLKGGQEAIEERARNELGMVRPGDSFYRVIPEKSAQGGK
ncbi:MAG: cell division protein FtsB [Enterobacteriaceae bacterium]|nr:cell division protein FtsB [Enterobacteriaceae bacterium]